MKTYSIRQAAKELELSHAQVRYLVRKGTLKATKEDLTIDGVQHGFAYVIKHKDLMTIKKNRPTVGRPKQS